MCAFWYAPGRTAWVSGMASVRSRRRFAFALVGFSLFAQVTAIGVQAQAPGTFRNISIFRNIGLVLTSVVGPGPVQGSQRLYASIAYTGGTFDILSIDPDQGATVVLHSPVPAETAVWDMVLGPDGNVYMGTVPGGHLLKLDTAHGTLVNLGVPSSSETYIWAVAFGSDHRLYGATYPHCKLVRYDPATGKMADLGRLDSTQQYARYLTATNDGFLYAGIGSAAAKVVAYQISSGKMKQILPEGAQVAGFAHTYVGDDAKVYSLTPLFDYRISGWEATEIAGADVHNPAAQNTLSDGRVATLDEENGALVLHMRRAAQNSDATVALDYEGEPNQLFRIGLGPDGKIYGSGALPSDLVRINDGGKNDYIGNLGDGEAYSMLAMGANLLLGTYADGSTLIAVNPEQPFSTDAGSDNPVFIRISGDDICWRPQAMVAGPDGKVYVGAQAGYGKLTGPLIAWNPTTGSAKVYSIVENQSVASLTSWKNLIVAGTTIQGGLGSKSVVKDAELLTWDPQNQQIISTSVPVREADTITDLIAGPNGLVYGFAGSTLFEFDPALNQVLRTQHTSLSGLIYNSVAIDKIGRIWGLSSQGIFTIDTTQFQLTMMGTPPNPITGGFAFTGGTIYFVSGTEVGAYVIPGALSGNINVSSSSGKVMRGDPVTITAAIASKSGVGPTGQIEFFSNGTQIGASALIDGRASLTTSNLGLGLNRISAGYGGDSYFEPANSGTIDVTNQAATNTTLTLPSAKAIAGNAVMFTATVSPIIDGVAPTGTVQFFDSGRQLGSPVTVAAGSAVLTTNALSGGAHQISARYSGDAAFVSSSSAELSQTVLGIDLKNSTPSASVTGGSSAGFGLTIASQGGFEGTVYLSCGGLPRGTACAFSPSSVATTGTSQLTISTTGAGATASLIHDRNSILRLGPPCLSLLFVGLVKRRRKCAWMFLALAVLQTTLSGCGVKVTPAPTVPVSNATPSGTYSITVTASGTVDGSSIAQKTVITLTVN
jgi:hypothetical protein